METIKEIKVNNRSVPGLMEMIREAMTEEEVNKLVTNGKINYTHASPKTIRKWERLAKERIEELKTPIIPIEEPSRKTEKKKSVKK